MYLKKLEITGFKSFPKKTTLTFESPITAIVGPNGSGKSNIVEALRFVLGEQKVKTLRGKSGPDLIFKGSKGLPGQSRASVSVIFDNRDKVFSAGGGKINIDYDEITLTREVYRDGVNKYLINGTEVRLKDILEMLSGVNIGSSGHHIISQGEADRILNTSPKERREMIEDALGLRIYKYRLRESERKLEKTRENLKEVQLQRREITPHIKFLKRQVEKIEKADTMRKELELLYREYLKKEEEYVKKERQKVDQDKKTLNQKLNETNTSLDQSQNEEGAYQAPAKEKEIEDVERQIKEIRSFKDELSRKLGRLEGMIEVEEKNKETEKQRNGEAAIPADEVESFIEDLNKKLGEAISKKYPEEVVPILERMKELVNRFLDAHIKVKKTDQPDEEREAFVELKRSQEALLQELRQLGDRERELEESIARAREKLDQEKEQEKEQNRLYYELKMKQQELLSELDLLKVREERLSKTEQDFEEEVIEAEVLIGSHILSYQSFVLSEEDSNESRASQEEQRKKIERLKIKLEDSGAAGGGDILKEYEEVTERDQFLAREVEDLDKSIESLEVLMRELREKLDIEFKTGIEKITIQFNEFFKQMFGGGTASLSVVAKPKRRRGQPLAPEDGGTVPTMHEDRENEFDEEELAPSEVEEGIEINVSLPRKKAKDLHALSGGERSLTSIALLFALTRVNPPPFLVLDETDAALDEANSRKYGDMIERLTEYSQLILVTHNRETMSRAHVLYGVTMGADGASKLLSVKFDEAVAISK